MELDFLQLGTMGFSHILFGHQMEKMISEGWAPGIWDHPGQSTDNIFDILFTLPVQSFAKPIHSFFPVFPIFHFPPSFITTTIKLMHWNDFNGTLSACLRTSLNCEHCYQRTLPFLPLHTPFPFGNHYTVVYVYKFLAVSPVCCFVLYPTSKILILDLFCLTYFA